MNQIFVEDNLFFGTYFECNESVFHHLFNVHRTRVKERLTLVTSQKRYCVLITNITKKKIHIEIESEQAIVKKYPEYTLFQALPKQDKMATIIDYVVQLGVTEIYPVKTERSIVQWDSKKESKNQERWISKAASAAVQAKRDIQPIIHPITPLNKLTDQLDFNQYDQLFVPWEEASIQDSLAITKNKIKVKKVAVFIGPEGGLAEHEIDFLRKSGFEQVYLGDSILRVEIASTVALSQLKLLYN